MFERQLNQPDGSAADYVNALPEGMALSSDAVQVTPPQTRSNSWQWLLMAASLCCTTGGIAVASFLWLVALPPTADCQTISSLSPDRERLFCAQEAVKAGELPELLAGLKLLGQWTPDHALYTEAQTSLEDWSTTVLNIARQRINQNDLKGAIELASQIPQSSPTYDEAQVTIAEWQQQWKQGEAIYTAAQEAIQQKDWERATQQVLALADLSYSYWRSQQTIALSQQIAAEQQAEKYLAQALKQAQGGNLEQLSAALKTASQIDRQTYTWKDAQTTLNQWGEVLLKAGLEEWQRGNLDQAIALGRRVVLNPAQARDAQSLVWLSHARQDAIASLSNWEASPEQIWQLAKAVAIASQIGPESRFYPQAQSSLASWQVQLQDLSQLQIAQLAAGLNQRSSLNFAIAQAQEVPSDRLRRIQAQTLIAHWRREIERIEDRPQLMQARQIAAQDTLPALREAIAAARQIAPGRALEPEAQRLIAIWQRRIERQEDQPFLNRARVLADQGRWNDAIQEAALIKPGRALYSQAQDLIGEWRGQIRAIEAARIRARRAARNLDRVPTPPVTPSVQPSEPEKLAAPEFLRRESGGTLGDRANPPTNPEPFPNAESGAEYTPPSVSIPALTNPSTNTVPDNTEDNTEDNTDPDSTAPEPAPRLEQPPIPLPPPEPVEARPSAVEPAPGVVVPAVPQPQPATEQPQSTVEPSPQPVEVPLGSRPDASEANQTEPPQLAEVEPVGTAIPVIYTGALHLGM